MDEIEVRVEQDHLRRLTSAKPLAAISELIWNAYDADAPEVRVEFEEGVLTQLGLIRVIDTGTGIKIEDANRLFGPLGGSWKQSTSQTKGGRIVHGEKGQGRFKAFALGNSVKWTFSSEGRRFSIAGTLSNIKSFKFSDLGDGGQRGCVVEIDEIERDFEIRANHGFADQIRDVFAIQLYEDPQFQIIYDGETINAREAIQHVESYDISADIDELNTVTGTLQVIEWKKRVDRKLLLCLPGKFAFHSMAPGIHARGFEFTAYLTAGHFQTMADENREGLVELDSTAVALIDASKQKLRQHFREREVERSRAKIQEWKEAKIYPYEGETTDPIERNERQLFDVVALNLSDYSSEFDKSPSNQKKLILQLLKSAVESGDSSLPIIFEKVIGLPKEKQEELVDLLRKTTLTAIINASKAVTNRLDFIKALQILIFDPKSKRKLLERSQLHRIIAQETWMFGERYNLMNDDEDLRAVLRSHIALLDPNRSELAPLEPVLDTEGKAKIVDLMLSCRLPTPTDDERKHLVIELKRPSQPINEDVINQVRKYAKTVALDDRFKNSQVEWDFVAVSNGITRDAELEARQTDKPRGLVLELDEPRIRVWARTWGEIIDEAEGRLTFFKRGLEYQANDKEAIRYLQNINEDYLSEEVKERIRALKEEQAADT